LSLVFFFKISNSKSPAFSKKKYRKRSLLTIKKGGLYGDESDGENLK
jgi:hypothetical protein